MGKKALRTHYDRSHKLEAFYTRGHVQVTDCGHLVCMCATVVTVTDISSSKTIHTFEEDDDSVASFCLSPDNALLVISWKSLLLRQYDWSTKACVRKWKGHLGPVVSMTFDHTSTLLATGSTDGVVKVWDCMHQYCTHNLTGSVGVVSLLKFHPHQSILFSTSDDYIIRVWDLSTTRCVSLLKSHVSPVTDISVTHDDNLISSGRDKVIHMWVWSTGQVIKTLPVFEAVEGCVTLPNDAGSPDDVVIATGGDKGMITIWDMIRGVSVTTLDPLDSAQTPHMYTNVLLHGHQLITTTSDHSIIFYDINTWRAIKHLAGYLDDILDIKCVGRDQQLVAMATNSEQIKLFNWSNGDYDVISGHSDIVMSLACSSDGCTIVSGSKDNTVRIWRFREDKFVSSGLGRGHTKTVTAVACARATPPQYAVSTSSDLTIKVWDLTKDDTVSVTITFKGHNKDINCVDVAPNDKLIVTASQDKTAKIWHPDGTLYGVLRGHKRGIWSVTFSTVDQCVLSASGDSVIKLWAVNNCTCLKTFEGHEHSVLNAMFISQGTQIVSSDNHGIIKIWDIKGNECVSTMDGHEDKVWSLAAYNDGQYILSGGADSALCFWKDVTQDVVAKAQNERDQLVIKEQELMNYLSKKDYVKAVCLGLSLEQPYRVLNILTELVDSEGGDQLLLVTIQSLREDQLQLLLAYVSKWNTNTKHCIIAQHVWHIVMSNFTPQYLMSLNGISDTLKTAIPYTERHFQRLTRLQQLSSFVDYTWHCMKGSVDTK